jgi:MoaA/NifB/PqqE/SkfB family radical SAM enzyme
MIDYDFDKAKTSLMCEGARRLSALGCKFFAIYGSSPLWKDEFLGLPEFIKAAHDAGVMTTIITDGIDKASKEKLTILYEHGLRSLTCSYDADPDKDVHVDKMTRLKSGKGLELIRWFKDEFEDLRDVEVVSTVTKKNWRNVLEVIPGLSQEGIWFSFDFIHPDRGNPGTKCKGDAAGLMFEPGDEDLVVEFASGMLNMVRNDPDALIHQSEDYLEALANDPTIITKLQWKCTGPTFPSWLTIDADGTVLPCDDFWTDRSFKVWALDEPMLAEFKKLYEAEVTTKCSGCAWSTHWDAVHINENGFAGFDHYVHK